MNRDPRFCLSCGGELSLREVDGRSRPACPRCGQIIYLNPAPSVAAILRQNGRILLVKRAIEPGLGLWSLPGGFIEEDETTEQAVVREVAEETGLLCRPQRIVGVHTMRSPVYGSILVLCYSADVLGGSLLAGGDAADAQFFPADHLPEIAFEIHRRFVRHEEAQHG